MGRWFSFVVSLKGLNGLCLAVFELKLTRFIVLWTSWEDMQLSVLV